MVKKTYRKAKGSKRASRPRYRSKRKSKPTYTVVRSPVGGIFNDRLFTKVRYNYLYTMTGASLPSHNIQMRLNGPYDPVAAAGGGQPLGWDQLSAMYLKYKVHHCNITIKANNLTTVPTYIVCYPVSTASPAVGLQSDTEQRYSKNRLISGSAGGGTGILKNAMTVKKLFGEKMLDDQFEALTASAVPTQQGYWNVSCYSVDGSTAVNMPVMISVEYFVEFTDPVRLGLS